MKHTATVKSLFQVPSSFTSSFQTWTVKFALRSSRLTSKLSDHAGCAAGVAGGVYNAFFKQAAPAGQQVSCAEAYVAVCLTEVPVLFMAYATAYFLHGCCFEFWLLLALFA